MKHIFLSSLLAALLWAGCSSEPEIKKSIVSGTVTYNGEPIQAGQIQFHPTEGTKGPMAAGIIINGKYQATAAGGVPVGKHQVKIYGYTERPDLRKADVPFAPTPREQYVPQQYNEATELTATVEAGSEKPLDFHLEGPPKKIPPSATAAKAGNGS